MCVCAYIFTQFSMLHFSRKTHINMVQGLEQMETEKPVAMPKTEKFEKICEQVFPIQLYGIIKIQVYEDSWQVNPAISIAQILGNRYIRTSNNLGNIKRFLKIREFVELGENVTTILKCSTGKIVKTNRLSRTYIIPIIPTVILRQLKIFFCHVVQNIAPLIYKVLFLQGTALNTFILRIFS